MRGLPVGLEIHDFPQGGTGPRLFRYFLKSRGARGIVAISRALLADLEAAFDIPPGLSVTVEPDGVDLARFADLPGPSDARTALGLPERFTAVYTGHLYAGRGVKLILDLAARQPDITFVIAGGRDKDAAQVRAQAADLPNVLLAGFIPNTELPTWQAAGDVLLMPYQRAVSGSSGGDIAAYLSPMKLFEYLACGRPILSSDLPVFREVLDEHLAVLLPPEDVNAWAAALQNLAGDPDRRHTMGRQGRAVAGGYSWRARAERILEGLG
jgi:glycosyltransferase involved in cell wall biosynthesis